MNEDKPTPADGQLIWVALAFIAFMLTPDDTEEHICLTANTAGEPSNFAAKHRAPNFYIFECKRCGKSIFATLKEKQNGN